MSFSPTVNWVVAIFRRRLRQKRLFPSAESLGQESWVRHALTLDQQPRYRVVCSSYHPTIPQNRHLNPFMSNRSTSTASITIPVQIDQTEKNVSKEIGQDPASAPDPFQVFLEPTEHPQNLSSFRKWLAVIVISSSALCATSASSIVRNSLAFCDQLASSAQASFTEIAVAEEFHVSHVVTILSISLFVEGLGVGPLLVGPLSEVYGRNIVYQVSYTLFFAFSWPVAFAPNIGKLFCSFCPY